MADKPKRARGFVQEMIGRVAFRLVGRYLTPTLTTDETQADYTFYDELARGKRPTYKLAGLFVQPIIHHIVAWTLGKGVTAACDHEPTAEALNNFLDREQTTLIDWMKEALRLGDSYLVVNPDGSLTQVPPNQVEITPDALDAKQVYGYTITTKLEKADITDEFRLDGRTVTIKPKTTEPLKTNIDLSDAEAFVDADGELTRGYRMRYTNIIGRLPVVHYANNRGSNELYGRPEVEALVEALSEYDDTLTKTLQGVKLMGNPMPAMEDVEDVDAAIDAIATGTKHVVNRDGSEEDVPVIDYDVLEMIVTSGKFSYKGPGPFTQEAWTVLKNLFYLMLQHSHVPEWVWGGAIASSKASVDAQMPAWDLFIALRRMVVTPLIVAVLQIWLAYRTLVEPGLRADVDITLQWPGLTDEDAEIKLKKVALARKEGLLDKVDALSALDLVEDPAAAVAKADQEAEDARADFEAQADREIARLAAQDDDEGEDEDDALPGAA